jgi:acetoacetyl-CoA reductase
MGGIGTAICQRLYKDGFTVVAGCGPTRDYAKWLAEQKAAGFEFHASVGNVGDWQSTVEAFSAAKAAHGPIDVLVNNAGITRDTMLHKMSLEQWREVLDVNLGGCFSMCRAVIGGMRERRFGRIVNMGSVNGLSGQAGQVNYAATKAGLVGFTKSLALEGASRNITANVVAPGYTDTPMVEAVAPETMARILSDIPAGRLATPAEIARGVVFLVADESAFINGITLSINGGKYMA